MRKNGISDSSKLKMAESIAESGKLSGCRLIDFSIEALSINEVITCKIEAEIKFQKISPLNAYKAKCSMWLTCWKTTISISKKRRGFSMLQNNPKNEFLYLSLMVLIAKLNTALWNPLLSNNVLGIDGIKKSCKFNIIISNYGCYHLILVETDVTA